METSDHIIDSLYLGGVMAALNVPDLQAKKITHILTVDEKPLPDALLHTSNFRYKHVFALDLYDCDLLNYFMECFDFIDEAREGGGAILVHCQAGISRSATVVAAYIMQKHRVTKEDALGAISIARRFVKPKPNEGFLVQLQVFENMGCRVDKTHPEYRAFQLNKLAIRFKCGQFLQGDPEIPSEIFVQPDYSAKGNDAIYKCRKCRMFLFHEGALTSHNVGQGESAFDWRSRVPTNKRDTGSLSKELMCHTSLFVDPLTWMKGKINAVQGKLNCPKCSIKIGSYVWYGEKCPCGAWVAPAFHVDNGKVDKIPSQPVLPQTHFPVVVEDMAEPASTSQPVHHIGSVTAFVGSGSSGRPLTQNPLPERPMTGSTAPSASPVAAVQPRIASSLVSMEQHLQVSSTSRSLPSLSVQSMDFEVGEMGGSPAASVVPYNRDLESGINSIHMDVDNQ